MKLRDAHNAKYDVLITGFILKSIGGSMKSQKAFVVFLLNDGYQPIKTKQGVSYVRDGYPAL